MTWDELLGKIREGMGESGAHLRALENMIAAMGKDNGDLSRDQVGIMMVLLTLAMSNFHSVIEHMSIGLDAVVETLRDASETPEAKDE